MYYCEVSITITSIVITTITSIPMIIIIAIPEPRRKDERERHQNLSKITQLGPP